MRSRRGTSRRRAAWRLARRNCAQVVSACRLGAGGIVSAVQTRPIVDAPTRWPSVSSSPWIRFPSCGSGVASRSMSAAISALTGGRPARTGQAGFRVTRRRCHRRTVPGGDQPVHRQPSRQEADQRGEHSAAGPVQARPRIGAAQHGDLVPQYQQLRVRGGGLAAGQDQPPAQPREDQVEQTEGHRQSSRLTPDPGASLQLTGQADFWHLAT